MGEYKGFPSLRDWFERTRGRGKFYYSNQHDLRRFETYRYMVGPIPPPGELPEALLDDGRIVEYTYVIFEDAEAATESGKKKPKDDYKKRFPDAVFLGRGRRLFDCVKEVISNLEEDFKS